MGELAGWLKRGGEARLQLALLVACALVLPVAGALYLWLPPSMDQWQLDYTGWLITRGKAPYLDIRDGNWPAAHWLHALSIMLSGPTFGAWRRFDLLVLVPTVVAGALLSARIWGRSAALWFGLLYPCLYVSSGYWFAGQRDIVASHFGLISMAAYWSMVEAGDRRRGGVLGLLSGASLTVATLIKPTFAVVALVIALHASFLALTKRQTTAVSIATVGRVAFWSVASLLAALVLLWVQGSTWESFWEHGIRSMLMRIPNDALTASESLGLAGRIVTRSWHWLLVGSLAATGFAIRSGDPKQRSGALLIWLFVLGGLLSHVVQGHGFLYYLGPVFLGLVMLSCGLLGIASRFLTTDGLQRTVAGIAILIALLGTGKKMVGIYGALIPVATAEGTLHDWDDRFRAGDGLSAAEVKDLAEELRPLLPDDATLLVWGRANLLNLLLERPQPTGFYHHPHIERDYLPEELATRWRAEFMHDLNRRPPVVALIHSPQNGADSVKGMDTALQRQLEAFLSSRYRAVRTVGTSTLYVLEEGARDAKPFETFPGGGELAP